MKNHIPNGPFDNPRIDEGVYDAEIDHLVEGTYGKDHEMYLKIAFRLPGEDLWFVTNLYFPNGRSTRSEQRLWHFCQIVGLDKEDVANQPEAFVGRRLRLEIERIQSPCMNYGRAYCDVKRFLPALDAVEPAAVPLRRSDA